MSNARPLNASIPFIVPVASISRWAVSNWPKSVLRSSNRSVVTPPASRRLLSPGPSGVNGRCATPRNPGSVPMLMPRSETNGGTSLLRPPRTFDTTAPNDGCPAVRLVFSL